MRQTRIAKHRSRPAAWKQAPLPLDGRDLDIVKAHQLARNPGSRGLADGSPAATWHDPAGRARQANSRLTSRHPDWLTTEDNVHPVILQELAAQRVKAIIAQADAARRARQARTSDQLPRPAQPSWPPAQERGPVSTAAVSGPALRNSYYPHPLATEQAARGQAMAIGFASAEDIAGKPLRLRGSVS